MALHDAGTPETIYHVVQRAVWDPAQAAGNTYLPPTYGNDGFIHATHEANLLLGVLNYRSSRTGFSYQDCKDTFLCLAIDTAALTSPVKM